MIILCFKLFSVVDMISFDCVNVCLIDAGRDKREAPRARRQAAARMHPLLRSSDPLIMHDIEGWGGPPGGGNR